MSDLLIGTAAEPPKITASMKAPAVLNWLANDSGICFANAYLTALFYCSPYVLARYLS